MLLQSSMTSVMPPFESKDISQRQVITLSCCNHLGVSGGLAAWQCNLLCHWTVFALATASVCWRGSWQTVIVPRLWLIYFLIFLEWSAVLRTYFSRAGRKRCWRTTTAMWNRKHSLASGLNSILQDAMYWGMTPQLPEYHLPYLRVI